MPDQIFAEYRAMTEAGKKEEAMAWLREKAENGDTEAMAFLEMAIILEILAKQIMLRLSAGRKKQLSREVSKEFTRLGACIFTATV